MELFKHAGNPEQQLGEWHTYASHPTDPALSMRVRVRRIPAAIDDRLRRFAGYANKSKLGVKGDTVILNSDRDQALKLNVLRAAWAMTETENAEVRAADESSAAFWAKLTGGIVAAGDLVPLDALWGENEVGKPSDVRRIVLNEQDGLRTFVLKTADAEALAADEEDEGKGKTS